MIKVSNVYDKMDKIAPFSFQQKWDNSGLITGDKENEVSKILLALDITKDVALEAQKGGYDVVISHHPVIFNALNTLSNQNPAVILAKNNISAICAHTNLDMARGGINDIIAEKFGAQIIDDPMEVDKTRTFYQISVFVPVKNKEQVFEAMCKAGAGALGDYKDCGFSVDGTGTFMPIDGANPYIGSVGKREEVKETKLEMIVPFEKRSAVITAMLEAHPYEKVPYSLFENQALVEKYGFGKVCKLKKPVTIKEFAQIVKNIFGNTVIRFNDTGKMISTFGFCSGGGGGLIDQAIDMGLDAYVCGDVKHDKFIDANNYGLAVFDAGHYHTEVIVLPYLKEKLAQQFTELTIDIAKADKDVCSYLV